MSKFYVIDDEADSVGEFEAPSSEEAANMARDQWAYEGDDFRFLVFKPEDAEVFEVGLIMRKVKPWTACPAAHDSEEDSR